MRHSHRELPAPDAYVCGAGSGVFHVRRQLFESFEQVFEYGDVARQVGLYQDGALVTGHGLAQRHSGHYIGQVGRMVEDDPFCRIAGADAPPRER